MILRNISDKDKENELKQEYDIKYLKYSEIKQTLMTKQAKLQEIYKDHNSIHANINSIDTKMAKDFSFWHSVMIKKFEFESKYGKIQIKNSRNETNSLNTSIQSINSKKINNSTTNFDSRVNNNDSSIVNLYAEKLRKTNLIIDAEINKNK